jgi:hypothetical protein
LTQGLVFILVGLRQISQSINHLLGNQILVVLFFLLLAGELIFTLVNNKKLLGLGYFWSGLIAAPFFYGLVGHRLGTLQTAAFTYFVEIMMLISIQAMGLIIDFANLSITEWGWSFRLLISAIFSYTLITSFQMPSGNSKSAFAAVILFVNGLYRIGIWLKVHHFPLPSRPGFKE